MAENKSFRPFIGPEKNVRELTVKSILLGSLFGVIFGAATVYLALKAGLTVSASIPIAVIAITLGRKFFKTTILENNIIQTTGSAGESIAAIIQEEAFESLDAPVRVVGALDTPVPYSPPLEEFFLPSEVEIERAARLLVDY